MEKIVMNDVEPHGYERQSLCVKSSTFIHYRLGMDQGISIKISSGITICFERSVGKCRV